MIQVLAPISQLGEGVRGFNPSERPLLNVPFCAAESFRDQRGWNEAKCAVKIQRQKQGETGK